MTNFPTQLPTPWRTLPTVSIEKDKNECNHTFPLWMVIPQQGCTVNCPICRKPRFIPGSQIIW